MYHRDLSILFRVQNGFVRVESCNINLNTKCVVLFITPERCSKPYPQTDLSWEDMFFLEVSEDVIMLPYGYLFVDLNIYHQRLLG